MAEGLVEKILPAIFGTSVSTQLFIYCYGGQLLLDGTKSVAKDLYDLDRDFNIIAARTKKPSQIKAFFFTADLPAFVSIINSTGSLITMLESLVE